VIRRALIVLLLAGCASVAPPRPQLFEFHDNMWMNLHHFLRAIPRGMPASGNLNAAERASWDEAVAFYKANYVSRDLLFDDGMVAIKNDLRNFDGKSSLEGAKIDPAMRATLERVAPIYRKYWWPSHQAANEKWIAAARETVRLHGAQLAEKVAAAYDERWPATPVPVDVTVTAGPNNAYTTSPPTHVTISSLEPTIQGLASLELLFHESSHGWGGRLYNGVFRAAEAQKKNVPRQLWHAVLFYNAGDLTRRQLECEGIKDYLEYAAKHGIYKNLCGDGCRDRVAAAWNRRLAGQATNQEALDALVATWPE
jgi:hypothetical protein